MVSLLPAIQLSGFAKSEKKSLIDMIKKLGGSCYSQMEFHEECTLLVIKKPCRSEKFLCALATGIPIVHADYITDSFKDSYWLDVRDYVWCSSASDKGDVAELFAAPSRVMERKSHRQKAFSKWTCALAVQNPDSMAVYKRILSAGGAHLVNMSLDNVTSARDVPLRLTHFIAESSYKGRSLNIVAESSVHCVLPEYMGDFLINGKPPQPSHYVVPFHDRIVIDLTASPAVSTSSISQDQAKNDIDSDVEITSWSSPVRSHAQRQITRPSLSISSATEGKKAVTDLDSQIHRLKGRSDCRPLAIRSLNGQLSSCSIKKETNLPSPLPSEARPNSLSSTSHVSSLSTTLPSSHNASGKINTFPTTCNKASYHTTPRTFPCQVPGGLTSFPFPSHVSGQLATSSYYGSCGHPPLPLSYVSSGRCVALTPTDHRSNAPFPLPTPHCISGEPYNFPSLHNLSGRATTLPSAYPMSGGPPLSSTYHLPRVSSAVSPTYHASGPPFTATPTYCESTTQLTAPPTYCESTTPFTAPPSYSVSNGFARDRHIITCQAASKSSSTALSSSALSKDNQASPFPSTPQKRLGNREDFNFSLNTKKYSKILLLTPPKVDQRRSGSMGSGSGYTPAKVPRLDTQVEVPLERTSVAGSGSMTPISANSVLSESSSSRSASSLSQPQTPNHNQSSGSNSLSKTPCSTVTVTDVEKKLTKINGPTAEQEVNGSFIKAQSQPKEVPNSNVAGELRTGSSITVAKYHTYDCAAGTSNVSVTSKETSDESVVLEDRAQVLKDQPSLGLLKHLTKRLSFSERQTLYDKHELLREISAVPIDMELNVTDESPEEELQQLPVLLQKQICTYFEDEYGHDNLSGLELLSLCTSRVRYPQALLLKQIYHQLLTSADPLVLHSLHDYLASRLNLNPPNKRLHEDGVVGPSNPHCAQRMRLVYMNSFLNREYFERVYLKYLSTAVQTIVKGGHSLEDDSQETANEDVDESEEEDEVLKSPSQTAENSIDVVKESSADRDGLLGSILFIDFLHDLLVKDYHTTAEKRQSMLYEICKGSSFYPNLVDSKDSQCLLDVSEQLLQQGEMELAHKLFKLIGLLGELCRSDSHMKMEHSLACVVRHVSRVIKECTVTSVEDILVECLPSWLAWHVVRDMLQDSSAYSNQLIHPSADALPLPSLQYVMSNYLFLIPSKSKVANRSTSTPSTPSTPLPCQPSHLSLKLKINHKGETPLHTACIRGDSAKVRQLLQDGETNVNTPDNAGWTALHEACHHKHEDIVELLLTHKSSGFHFDGGGEVDMLATAGDDAFTPLHDAVDVGSVGIVKLFLKHGDKKKLLTANSKLGTVFDMADGEILELLNDALNPVEGNENNNSAESQESSLHIAAPRTEIYHTHRCSTNGKVIERYVTYCSLLVSFYVATFPLTSTDKKILNSLSLHLEHFTTHLKWLSSDADELPSAVSDRLRNMLLLSI